MGRYVGTPALLTADVGLVTPVASRFNNRCLYTTPGNYTFTVPNGVCCITAVAVGPGGKQCSIIGRTATCGKLSGRNTFAPCDCANWALCCNAMFMSFQHFTYKMYCCCAGNYQACDYCDPTNSACRSKIANVCRCTFMCFQNVELAHCAHNPHYCNNQTSHTGAISYCHCTAIKFRNADITFYNSPTGMGGGYSEIEAATLPGCQYTIVVGCAECGSGFSSVSGANVSICATAPCFQANYICPTIICSFWNPTKDCWICSTCSDIDLQDWLCDQCRGFWKGCNTEICCRTALDNNNGMCCYFYYECRYIANLCYKIEVVFTPCVNSGQGFGGTINRQGGCCIQCVNYSMFHPCVTSVSDVSRICQCIGPMPASDCNSGCHVVKLMCELFNWTNDCWNGGTNYCAPGSYAAGRGQNCLCDARIYGTWATWMNLRGAQGHINVPPQLAEYPSCTWCNAWAFLCREAFCPMVEDRRFTCFALCTRTKESGSNTAIGFDCGIMRCANSYAPGRFDPWGAWRQGAGGGACACMACDVFACLFLCVRKCSCLTNCQFKCADPSCYCDYGYCVHWGSSVNYEWDLTFSGLKCLCQIRAANTNVNAPNLGDFASQNNFQYWKFGGSSAGNYYANGISSLNDGNVYTTNLLPSGIRESVECGRCDPLWNCQNFFFPENGTHLNFSNTQGGGYSWACCCQQGHECMINICTCLCGTCDNYCLACPVPVPIPTTNYNNVFVHRCHCTIRIRYCTCHNVQMAYNSPSVGGMCEGYKNDLTDTWCNQNCIYLCRVIAWPSHPIRTICRMCENGVGCCIDMFTFCCCCFSGCSLVQCCNSYEPNTCRMGVCCYIGWCTMNEYIHAGNGNISCVYSNGLFAVLPSDSSNTAATPCSRTMARFGYMNACSGVGTGAGIAWKFHCDQNSFATENCWRTCVVTTGTLANVRAPSMLAQETNMENPCWHAHSDFILNWMRGDLINQYQANTSGFFCWTGGGCCSTCHMPLYTFTHSPIGGGWTQFIAAGCVSSPCITCWTYFANTSSGNVCSYSLGSCLCIDGPFVLLNLYCGCHDSVCGRCWFGVGGNTTTCLCSQGGTCLWGCACSSFNMCDNGSRCNCTYYMRTFIRSTQYWPYKMCFNVKAEGPIANTAAGCTQCCVYNFNPILNVYDIFCSTCCNTAADCRCVKLSVRYNVKDWWDDLFPVKGWYTGMLSKHFYPQSNTATCCVFRSDDQITVNCNDYLNTYWHRVELGVYHNFLCQVSCDNTQCSLYQCNKSSIYMWHLRPTTCRTSCCIEFPKEGIGTYTSNNVSVMPCCVQTMFAQGGAGTRMAGSWGSSAHVCTLLCQGGGLIKCISPCRNVPVYVCGAYGEALICMPCMLGFGLLPGNMQFSLCDRCGTGYGARITDKYAFTTCDCFCVFTNNASSVGTFPATICGTAVCVCMPSSLTGFDVTENGYGYSSNVYLCRHTNRCIIDNFHRCVRTYRWIHGIGCLCCFGGTTFDDDWNMWYGTGVNPFMACYFNELPAGCCIWCGAAYNCVSCFGPVNMYNLCCCTTQYYEASGGSRKCYAHFSDGCCARGSLQNQIHRIFGCINVGCVLFCSITWACFLPCCNWLLPCQTVVYQATDVCGGGTPWWIPFYCVNTLNQFTCVDCRIIAVSEGSGGGTCADFSRCATCVQIDAHDAANIQTIVPGRGARGNEPAYSPMNYSYAQYPLKPATNGVPPCDFIGDLATGCSWFDTTQILGSGGNGMFRSTSFSCIFAQNAGPGGGGAVGLYSDGTWGGTAGVLGGGSGCCGIAGAGGGAGWCGTPGNGMVVIYWNA